MKWSPGAFRREVKDAVIRLHAKLRTQLENEPLFGFALCTDDDVVTLYQAACTASWFKSRSSKSVEEAYNYNDWPLELENHEELYRAVAMMQASHDQYSVDEEEDLWAQARDERVFGIAAALEECREEGLFDDSVLLCMGSTDPLNRRVAELSMQAVKRMNSPAIAEMYVKLFGD